MISFDHYGVARLCNHNTIDGSFDHGERYEYKEDDEEGESRRGADRGRILFSQRGRSSEARAGKMGGE